MIWGLFEKPGLLDSDQKHKSASENNLSNLVSEFCSARSRGTCAKCVFFIHKSIFLSVYCSLWCGRSASWVPFFLCWLNICHPWNEKGDKVGPFSILWPSMRDICHFSHVTINDLHWPHVSHVCQIKLMQPWRIKQFFFPACCWMPLPIFLLLFKDYLFHNLLQKIFFLLRIILRHTARIEVCTHLPNGPPQHGVSCVSPTDLLFPGVFLCAFCLQEVWIREILIVLVHKWWILTKRLFRDQRLKM